MLCQRHGATAAPEEQRYRRSLRRTHRALAESIGAAPGREGSTAARGEPGGSAGRGLAPPRAGMDLPGRGSGLPGWSCRDGPAAGTADGGERLVGWGHQPVPPPILRRSSARPPPPSRLSHGLREAGLGFFWDQIVPAWAGQTRPLGYDTAQKPPMNFYFLCWRCTSQKGMSTATPISHGSLPKSGKLGPAVLQPHIPRAMGCCVLLALAEFRVGACTLSRAGSAPRSKIFPEPPSPAFQRSQSPFILHPNISRAPTFPEPPSSCNPAMS